jgi:hypothetical protein
VCRALQSLGSRRTPVMAKATPINDLLSEEELGFAKTYRYHGEDQSPLYKSVLSPLADWLVQTFVPLWLA